MTKQRTEEQIEKTKQARVKTANHARAIRLERIEQRKRDELNKQLDARLEEKKRIELEKKNADLNENDLQRKKTSNEGSTKKKLSRCNAKDYYSSDSESDFSDSSGDEVVVYKPKRKISNQKGGKKTTASKNVVQTVSHQDNLEKQLAEMNSRFQNLEALYSKDKRKNDILDSCQRNILKFN